MKKIITLLTLAAAILLSGCFQNAPSDCVGAYMAVIDKLYNEDSGLNGDIKYIAIDTSSMSNLDENSKAELLKQLEKYGAAVLDMTFEELESKGYIKNLYFTEGIFFRIEDAYIKNNSIKMNVSKWRSGLGAIGYNDMTVSYKNKSWKITKTGTAWIS